MQPALQWKHLITDVSDASQRYLNAREESKFYVSNEQLKGKCKFLSWDFSMLPQPISMSCKFISPIKTQDFYMATADQDRL